MKRESKPVVFHYLSLFLLIAAVIVISANGALASITFTGTNGTNLSASALFDVSGSDLTITLTNTSTWDVLVPVDVLTAVFFSLPGSPTLGRTSAVLGAGSTVFFGGTDPGGVVGGEWAYKSGLVGAPEGATQGISSAGFGLFGPPDRFPGNDLDSPVSPNGLNYGITSAGDNPATGNTPVTSDEPLIQNQVVFTLAGLPDGFDLSSISKVGFQYGTALSEPYIPGTPGTPGAPVPEPTTLLLFGSGLVAFASLGRNRLKSKKKAER